MVSCMEAFAVALSTQNRQPNLQERNAVVRSRAKALTGYTLKKEAVGS